MNCNAPVAEAIKEEGALPERVLWRSRSRSGSVCSGSCWSWRSTSWSARRGCGTWELCLRWTAAGMLKAESRFRNVQGRPRPRQPRSRDRTRPTPSPSECHSHPNRGGRRSTHCVTMTPGTAVTKVQRRTEQPRDS